MSELPADSRSTESPTNAPAPVATKFALPLALWAAMAAAGLLLIGTFMQWVSFGGLSASGTDTGDGKFVLFLSLAAAASIVGTRAWAPAYLFTGVFGLGSVATTLYDLVDISGSSTQVLGERIGPSVGSGLILDVIASLALVIAVVWHFREERRQSTASSVE